MLDDLQSKYIPSFVFNVGKMTVLVLRRFSVTISLVWALFTVESMALVSCLLIKRQANKDTVSKYFMVA